jgi:hypothetical protein
MQSESAQRVEETETVPISPDFADLQGFDHASGGNTKPITKRQLHPELANRLWKPGQSGNPSGRPKRAPITDAYIALLSKPVPGDKLKRTYAEAIAQAVAEKAIEGDTRAAQEITDRVEGRVVQKAELSGADGQPMQFESLGSRHEVEARVAQLFLDAQQRAEGRTVEGEIVSVGAGVPVSEEPVTTAELKASEDIRANDVQIMPEFIPAPMTDAERIRHELVADELNAARPKGPGRPKGSGSRVPEPVGPIPKRKEKPAMEF